LFLLLLVAVPPPGHATSQYVGYTTSAGPCGSCFDTQVSNNYASGLAVRAPFAGNLVSVSIDVDIAIPTSLVIATFPAGSNPTTTLDAGCNNFCGYVNSGQSWTIRSQEAVSLTSNSF